MKLLGILVRIPIDYTRNVSRQQTNLQACPGVIDVKLTCTAVWEYWDVLLAPIDLSILDGRDRAMLRNAIESVPSDKEKAT